MQKIILTTILFTIYFALHAQTGIPIPQMTACDNLVSNFMATHSIPGASFALTKNGKLVYHRAFGNANIAGNEPVQPHHLFRIASLSKPITSIAIMNMIEQNQISLTDKVFGTGGLLENHGVISSANITDSRIYNITVQHLLEHSAGWNRNVNCFPSPTSPYPYYFSGCDPIVAPLHVTQTNGTSNPVTEEDMIVFLLEKGLDFTPNTGYAYSNIGYLVLGAVIEEVSGQSYESYVQSSLFNQLGICDMHIGKTLLSEKQEREVEYIGNGYNTLSCYNTGSYVPWEYGGFNIEAMSAHGGWIATSRDLVKLLVAVDGFPSKPDILSSATITTMTTSSSNNNFYAKGWSVNSANNWWHTGALDGSATFFARTSGQYTWAILLNKRVIGSSSNQFWTDFDNLPWNCIAATSSYPTHDLLDLPTTNSSNIQFPNIGVSNITLSWTNGNGNNRIVVAKKNGIITHFPLDGQVYTANAAFQSGDNIGNDIYVVYNGTGNSVNVTNLQASTDYTFRVFEYNSTANTGYNALYKLCGGDEKQATTTMQLAVVLLEFNITEENKLAKLSWTTATETDNSHFDVEKSYDGKTFFKIETVLGKGNSTLPESYQALDSDIRNGLIYYRIKMVDFDGEFQYSQIKALHFASAIDFKLYPALSSHTIHIECPNSEPEVFYNIISASGLNCMEGSFEGSKHAIDIVGLNEGLYILNLKLKNGSWVRKKFVKI